jgi:hypothetical protein
VGGVGVRGGARLRWVLWLLRWVLGGVVNINRCGECGGVVCVGRGRLLGVIGVMMRMVYFGAVGLPEGWEVL